MATRARRTDPLAIDARATSERRYPGDSRVYYLNRNNTGVRVDEQTALQYVAVWRAVNLIAQAMASLGVRVLQREPDGTRTRIDDDPVRWLLAGQSSEGMPAFAFRETLTAHALTWGNGYAEVERTRSGDPVALHVITPDRVTPERTEAGALVYRVREASGPDTVLPEDAVFHLRGLAFDGLVGYSPMQLFKGAIGLGIAAERYGAAFFGQGGMPAGVLQTEKELGDTLLKRLRSEWQEVYGGPNNAGKVAILEDGLKWAGVSIPNDVAQFIETRKFQVTDVARMFGIPPHMLFDLERSTNNNIEHQGIEFVSGCLLAWARRWEAEIDVRLLGRDRMERGAYSRLNLDTLMRGDSAARVVFYKGMRDVGAFSPNDILELEDRDPVKGGDIRLVPMNMVPLERALEVLPAKGASAPPPDRGAPPDGGAVTKGADS